ncbi:MAG: histidine triad nucleotide-binding protein [Myxococcota bacterium]
MASNIFMKIINREIAADIVYEDEKALAFRDIKPHAPVHILIIPKKPVENIFSVEEGDEALLGHLFIVARKAAEKEGLAERGARIIINSGSDAGQEVPHLHLHLLGGQKMGWKPVG